MIELNFRIMDNNGNSMSESDTEQDSTPKRGKMRKTRTVAVAYDNLVAYQLNPKDKEFNVTVAIVHREKVSFAVTKPEQEKWVKSLPNLEVQTPPRLKRFAGYGKYRNSNTEPENSARLFASVPDKWSSWDEGRSLWLVTQMKPNIRRGYKTNCDSAIDGFKKAKALLDKNKKMIQSTYDLRLLTI